MGTAAVPVDSPRLTARRLNCEFSQNQPRAIATASRDSPHSAQLPSHLGRFDYHQGHDLDALMPALCGEDLRTHYAVDGPTLASALIASDLDLDDEFHITVDAVRLRIEKAGLSESLTVTDDHLDASRDADAIVVATEWVVFSEQDPAEIAELTTGRLVIDGRNCLDREAWKKAGFHYRGMGRS